VKIGIPCFGADAGRSGIGHYLIQLLRAMIEANVDDEFELLVDDREQRLLVPDSGRFLTLPINGRWCSPLANVAWHQTELPRWCHRRRWDALFLPAANRRLPFRTPCPTVGMVHDMGSLHLPGRYDPLRTFYALRVLPLLYRRLSRVLVPSESTRLDVVRHARVPPARVHVVPEAADDRFQPSDRLDARRRIAKHLGFDEPFVLYPARLAHPGKNHVRLIRAFAQLKEAHCLPHRLVLVGSDWTGSDVIRRAAAASSRRADIVFAGFVPAASLPDFYRASDGLVFPSLVEGFGLPVLEAMACGIPVACSDCSSLPEVAGDAAVMFDPTSEPAIVDALARLILDRSLRNALAQRGLARSRLFSWAKAASATLDTLALAAGRPRVAGLRES
jgi:glycosyltransferase involved in cell wall biosynthesis